MSKGCFITLEGGEGAGKSSCLSEITATLAAAGIEAECTREPGGTPLGERVREILLDPSQAALDPEVELLLMFAARAQHLRERIEPALQAGRWVVSDRFVDASHAYQGGGRGLDVDRIDYLEQWLVRGIEPDLTILLDVDAELGLTRATRDREADRFEQEQLAFYHRVRQAYRERARQAPGRIQVVDAGQPLDQVRSAVRDIVNRFIEEQRRS